MAGCYARMADWATTCTNVVAFSQSWPLPAMLRWRNRGSFQVLAGVSVEYCTRVERGGLAGVSDQILEAIAGALQLNEAELEHLWNLAKTASRSPKTRRQPARTIHSSMQRILDGRTGIPVFVQKGRLDIVAFNDLDRALRMTGNAPSADAFP